MVVEDDPAVRTVVADHLRAAGCDVAMHADGENAWIAVSYTHLTLPTSDLV